MKKILMFITILFSTTVFANDVKENRDALQETIASSEAQKPETLRRLRDTFEVSKNVASSQEGVDSPSVKAINSLSSFFEKRVKASNHDK